MIRYDAKQILTLTKERLQRAARDVDEELNSLDRGFNTNDSDELTTTFATKVEAVHDTAYKALLAAQEVRQS